jgi:tRNA threonylcarbamoyladenosine biosynthesis protein TsaE
LPEKDKKGAVDAAFVVDLPDEAATAGLAARLAQRSRQGDVIGLQGPLGSGKTTFARAFIRAYGGGSEEVPSPTFALVEVYSFADKPPVWHFDLYRLNAPEEAWELGIEEAWSEGVSLIEWPERLGPLLPPEHLLLAFAEGAVASARAVTLRATTSWAPRLVGIVDD